MGLSSLAALEVILTTSGAVVGGGLDGITGISVSVKVKRTDYRM